MTCPTVKVKDPKVEGGYQIINRSDFDPAVHVRLEPESDGETAAPKTKKRK